MGSQGRQFVLLSFNFAIVRACIETKNIALKLTGEMFNPW